MRVAIVASHAWSLPSPARGGDSQIVLDLSRTLAEFGHAVTLFAPAGTTPPEGVRLVPMPKCSNGTADPSTEDCEQANIRENLTTLLEQDVIHDCSVNKMVAEWALGAGKPCISTHWGGALFHPKPSRNVVACSHSQRDRLLRGETDYVGTDTPDAGGPNVDPIADARVVWPGVCVDSSYAPSGNKRQDFFLLLGRWHEVRGYRQAIDLAKRTGINLLLAGEDPTRDHPYQAKCALEACELARGCDNIEVEFLPDGDDHHVRKVELFSDAKATLFVPLFQEPFGLTQIESLACGTPVVALRRGSVPEVILDGTTGKVCDTMDEMAEYLQRSCPVPDHCRADALERWTRQRMAQDYVALYEEVASWKGWGA